MPRHDFDTPKFRELQVRDDEQRTRFLLVWATLDDDGAVIAVNRAFRTVRNAMAAGVDLFGILPVRITFRPVRRP